MTTPTQPLYVERFLLDVFLLDCLIVILFFSIVTRNRASLEVIKMSKRSRRKLSRKGRRNTRKRRSPNRRTSPKPATYRGELYIGKEKALPGTASPLVIQYLKEVHGDEITPTSMRRTTRTFGDGFASGSGKGDMLLTFTVSGIEYNYTANLYNIMDLESRLQNNGYNPYS